jgi:hypothetical protein
MPEWYSTRSVVNSAALGLGSDRVDVPSHSSPGRLARPECNAQLEQDPVLVAEIAEIDLEVAH